VEGIFRAHGLEFHAPKSKAPRAKQLTTENANYTRAVTKVRFIVEQFFGRLQSKFKFFSGRVRNVSLEWDSQAYKICAALLNMFHKRLVPDAAYPGTVQRLLERMEVENHLQDVISESRPSLARTRLNFERIRHDSIGQDFPQLTKADLYSISLGPYQINNALSYFGQNRDDDPQNAPFQLERYQHLIDFQAYEIDIEPPNAVLVRGQIKSRYSSTTVRKAFVLFDTSLAGVDAVREWYCDCTNGSRTAGCCSHVMSVVWYLCFAHDENPFPPRDGQPEAMFGIG
jgi:hypothetical protein